MSQELIGQVDRERAKVHDGKAGNVGMALSGVNHPGRVTNRGVSQRDGQNFGFQTLAAAGIAEAGIHERLEAIFRELAFALLVEPLQIRDNALKRTADLAHLACTPEGKLYFSGSSPVEQRFLEIFRQLAVGGFQTLAKMLGEPAQQTFVIGDHPLAPAPPWKNCSLLQRFLQVGRYERVVENHLLAEPMANRAGACGRVKGKMLWSQCFKTLAGGWAVISIGMKCFIPLVR